VNINDAITGQQVSAIPLAPTNIFDNNTWSQIAVGSNMIVANNWTSVQMTTNLGWSIGDIKTFVVGGVSYGLRIIGVRHDIQVGGGLAGLTLDLTSGWGPTAASPNRARFNTTGINSTGWDRSMMRQGMSGLGGTPVANEAVLPTIRELLPTDLLSVVKTVIKPTATNGMNTTLINSQDDLFLFSKVEIFGNSTMSATGEGTHYAWYAANNSGATRAKQQPVGVSAWWWLRSPVVGDNSAFCLVTTSGSASNGAATNNGAVSFGLCI